MRIYPSTIAGKPLQNVARLGAVKRAVRGLFFVTGEIWGAFNVPGRRREQMRTKTESVAGLLEGIQRAAEQKEFNILQDLQMLQTAYPKTSKRDYLLLLKKLAEKYSVDEAAEVHAALLRKCRAGDIEAIRLYGQMRQQAGGECQEVTIVDSI